MKWKTFISHPTICDKDLMCDWEFMNKDIIRDKCDCLNQSVCMMLVDLIRNNRLEEASDIIENHLWQVLDTTKKWTRK